MKEELLEVAEMVLQGEKKGVSQYVYGSLHRALLRLLVLSLFLHRYVQGVTNCSGWYWMV